MRDEVIEIIHTVIDDVNETLKAENCIDKAPDAVLFGRDGKLDSIGLVELVVEVEQEVSDRYDVRITIADERAMSQKASPFRSIAALADYIVELTQEQQDG